MVGANYTGGRRNAAKARAKDTTGRLQRGHFSKQRLGILTDALRSRRPDHQSLARSRPSAAADDPNLTPNSWSGYSTCAPAATVYDISLGHAKRDLAEKQQRQPAQYNSHLRRNGSGPFSPPLQPGLPHLDPRVRNDLPAVTPVDSLALTVNGKPDTMQTLLPATAISSCATPSSPSRSEPAFHRTSLPEQQSTPITEMPKRRSKILDLINISDREHLFFRTPRFAALPVSDISSDESQRASPAIVYRITPPYKPPRAFTFAFHVPNLSLS
jgi:hypothetical protein